MAEAQPMEIDVQNLAVLRAEEQGPVVLDVRDDWEREIVSLEGSLNIPMNTVPNRLSEIPKDEVVVVMCHFGGRSLQVMQWLRAQGWDKATNLSGGINAWAQQIDNSLATY